MTSGRCVHNSFLDLMCQFRTAPSPLKLLLSEKIKITIWAVLPGVAISRQSGYFGKPVAGKNLWLVATIIVAIFGLRIGLFVAISGLDSELGYLWLFLDLKLKWL